VRVRTLPNELTARSIDLVDAAPILSKKLNKCFNEADRKLDVPADQPAPNSTMRLGALT
jgi:hypothetical protein